MRDLGKAKVKRFWGRERLILPCLLKLPDGFVFVLGRGFQRTRLVRLDLLHFARESDLSLSFATVKEDSYKEGQAGH